MDLKAEPVYKIKTYTANFTINSTMAYCSPNGPQFKPNVLPGSVGCTVGEMSGCSCGERRGYMDPSICTESCNFIKAPVVRQLHKSDDFKRLYWNLDTQPTKGPRTINCGIRNCVVEVDWEGMRLK